MGAQSFIGVLYIKLTAIKDKMLEKQIKIFFFPNGLCLLIENFINCYTA